MAIPPLIGLAVTTAILAWWIWGLLKSLMSVARHVQRLHQIPCDRCIYCTREWHLKCTVHPLTAFSEQAIGCRDYEPTP